MGPIEFPDNPFWDFSLDIYGRRGVQRACLALQDRDGVDVTVALFCCWLGAAGHGKLKRAQIARLIEIVRPWREGVVNALRAVRRRLKAASRDDDAPYVRGFYARLSENELNAEHIQHLALSAALKAVVENGPADGLDSDQRAKAAAANLRTYFSLAEIAADGATRADLADVLEAVFPDTPKATLAALIETIGN